MVLIYLAVNVSAIRAFRTGFRDDFRFCRHLVIPATAVVFLLFPLWGILHPRGRTLMDLLPFAALGWLCLGVIAAWYRRNHPRKGDDISRRSDRLESRIPAILTWEDE